MVEAFLLGSMDREKFAFNHLPAHSVVLRGCRDGYGGNLTTDLHQGL
jgi:hypothetical protein